LWTTPSCSIERCLALGHDAPRPPSASWQVPARLPQPWRVGRLCDLKPRHARGFVLLSVYRRARSRFLRTVPATRRSDVSEKRFEKRFFVMGITSLAQHRASLNGLQEGGLLWPGWFVPLTGSFIAIRGLVPAWNSVPLASNSETASVSDARLSRIGRLGHDGSPGGVGFFSERDARNACGASCYGRAETALEGGSRDEAGAGK